MADPNASVEKGAEVRWRGTTRALSDVRTNRNRRATKLAAKVVPLIARQRPRDRIHLHSEVTCEAIDVESTVVLHEQRWRVISPG